MTIEATFGVVLLAVTAMTCLQLLLIGVQQVRLTATASEASRIAAASGDPATRISQAKEFVSREFAGNQSEITTDGRQVFVVLTLETRVFLLPFAPVLKAQSQSPVIDSLAVM